MRFLRILFCKHRATVLRWADGKMYVSCLDCPFDSPGVIMGSEQAQERLGVSASTSDEFDGLLGGGNRVKGVC